MLIFLLEYIDLVQYKWYVMPQMVHASSGPAGPTKAPYGDQMWQMGTNHCAIVGLGGPSAVPQMVRGTSCIAAINNPGGPILGGPVVA